MGFPLWLLNGFTRIFRWFRGKSRVVCKNLICLITFQQGWSTKRSVMICPELKNKPGFSGETSMQIFYPPCLWDWNDCIHPVPISRYRWLNVPKWQSTRLWSFLRFWSVFWQDLVRLGFGRWLSWSPKKAIEKQKRKEPGWLVWERRLWFYAQCRDGRFPHLGSRSMAQDHD